VHLPFLSLSLKSLGLCKTAKAEGEKKKLTGDGKIQIQTGKEGGPLYKHPTQ